VNLLLFDDLRVDDAGRLAVTGRQLRHLIGTLKPALGDSIRIGRIDGKLGTGVVVSLSSEKAILEVHLDREPPSAPALKLILALPRPKVLGRILQAVAALGIKELYLINSYRVEKSYWQTPRLRDEAIREALWLGLEQGCDTGMPRVYQHKLFRPFAEDQLPALAAGSLALVAHPLAAESCPRRPGQAITLAIGPEGGFIHYEINKLAEAGFSPVTLGPRILRVETALPFLLGRLCP
jgi:RsmE family RNA methyltransferase